MVTRVPGVDLTSPRSVAEAEFSTHRRGFDRDEVRALLEHVALEMQRLQDENALLAEQVAALQSTGGGPELDEATVTELLGEETARVLSTAREAASQMRAKAEEGVARLLRDAQDEASRVREEAALAAVRQHHAVSEGAEAEIEAAKQEGRQMVAEARAVRERMLTDLARRRDAARAQLARLRADRDRLVAAFEEAGRSVDDVLGDLRDAAPEPIEVETIDDAVAAVRRATGPGAEEFEPEHEDAAVDAVDAEDSLVEEPEPEPQSTPGPSADAPAPVSAAFHLGEEPEPEPTPSRLYTGELDAPAEPRSSVDDLFARLRASGPAEVAASASVDVETNGDGDEPSDGEAADAAPPDPDTAYLAERAIALDPLQSSMARRLKRALTDEQNEVLDVLRREALPADLDALVGAEAAHAERYRSALTSDLRSAASAGARSVGEARDVPSSDVKGAALDEVTAEFVVPLRERLTKALEDAGGDAVEAGATLRAAYREWRTQRADEVAAHLVLVAHGHGAYDALPPGTPIHWVVDPDGPLCPDADDNALGGVILAGEDFPTGDCQAPAHPGCRCGITITQG